MDIVESFVLWYKHMKELPNYKGKFLFYFAQSATDTVVIYQEKDKDVDMYWTKLTIQDVSKCTMLPSNLRNIFNVNKISDNEYQIPGDTSKWTIRTGKTGSKQFIDENNQMLLGLYADIDKEQMEIREYSKIVLDRNTATTRKYVLECPEPIKEQCKDMGTLSYKNLMTYLSS